VVLAVVETVRQTQIEQEDQEGREHRAKVLREARGFGLLLVVKTFIITVAVVVRAAQGKTVRT